MDTNIYDIFKNKVPIHTYTIKCMANTPVSLPPYAGSVLRGVLGHGLRKLRINDIITQTMGDMDKYRLCPYHMIFDPPHLDNPIHGIRDIPVPYVIIPPTSPNRLYNTGENIQFNITLIGNAIQKLPYIIHAFDTIMQQGIGKKNPHGNTGTACITAVYTQCNQLIWHNDNQSIATHTAYAPLPDVPQNIQSIKINIITPLRLQKQGELMTDPKKITAEVFLMACIRRVYALLSIHTNTPCKTDFAHYKKLAQNISLTHDLKFHNWTRYSNRQQQKMDLGGWVGMVTLNGNLHPFIPYIHLCQFVHIGKNTSFGLGKLSMETQQ